MKLGEIFKKKENNDIIQIDSFATHINGERDVIVVYRNIEKHSEFEIGSSPSFNGYGTKEEIEAEYDLLVRQEDLKKYSNWNEIFELLEY